MARGGAGRVGTTTKRIQGSILRHVRDPNTRSTITVKYFGWIHAWSRYNDILQHLPEMVVEKGDKLQKAEGKLKNHPYDLESWNVLIKDAQVAILLTTIADAAC